MASEKELVIYAKVGDYEGLKKAQQIIHQEQAQQKFPGGRMRVRMERPDGVKDYTYTFTTKSGYSQADGLQNCEEENTPVDSKVYEMFKSTCKDFQRKTRFVFKVENIKVNTPGMEAELDVPELVYEVDVFYTTEGKFSQWCKIDVELDGLFAALKAAGIDTDKELDLKLQLSSLPFKPKDAYMETAADPKSKELTWTIYEKEFNRPLQVAAPAVAVERHHSDASKGSINLTQDFNETPADVLAIGQAIIKTF